MKTSFLIIGLIFFSSFFIADNIQAQVQLTDYKLLEPLPFITDGPNSNTTNAEIYIPGLINLAIAVAGAAAVLRIIYGGFLYISSDAINKKKEGIGVIKETFWGLFFVLSAWAIVYTLREGSDGQIEFNLNIPTQELKANENSAGTSTGGGQGVGCQGDCPYSYVKGNTTIRYKDCNSCSIATSFLLDIKDTLVNGQRTMINTNLGNKLKELKSLGDTPSFKVTETWPPTVNHRNQKQYDGTSVDISLITPSASNISFFLRNSERLGINAVYEVGTQAKKTSYVNQGVPANKIIVVSYITGEHFSIE